MKIFVNTEETASKSKIRTEVDFTQTSFEPIYYGDKLNLLIIPTANSGNPSWIGEADIFIKIGTFEGDDLYSATKGVFNGVEHEWTFDLGNDAFEAFTRNVESRSAYIEMQRTGSDGITQTFLQMPIEVRNQLLHTTEVELSIPYPPNFVSVEKIPIPSPPISITALAGAGNPTFVRSVNLTRSRTEDPQSYPPTPPLWIEVNIFTAPAIPSEITAIRSPHAQQVAWVHAGILPTAPDLPDAEILTPFAPSELGIINLDFVQPTMAFALEIGTIPKEPNLLAVTATSHQPTEIIADRSPKEPDQIITFLDTARPAGWWQNGPSEIVAEQLFAPNAVHHVNAGLGANPEPSNIQAYNYNSRPAWPEPSAVESAQSPIEPSNLATQVTYNVENGYNGANSIDPLPLTIRKRLEKFSTVHVRIISSYSKYQQYVLTDTYVKRFFRKQGRQWANYGEIDTTWKRWAWYRGSVYVRGYINWWNKQPINRLESTVGINLLEVEQPSHKPWYSFSQSANSDAAFDQCVANGRVTVIAVAKNSASYAKKIAMLNRQINERKLNGLYSVIIEKGQDAETALNKLFKVPTSTSSHEITIDPQNDADNFLWYIQCGMGRYPDSVFQSGWKAEVIVNGVTEKTLETGKALWTEISHPVNDVTITTAELRITAIGNNTTNFTYPSSICNANQRIPKKPYEITAHELWTPYEANLTENDWWLDFGDSANIQYRNQANNEIDFIRCKITNKVATDYSDQVHAMSYLPGQSYNPNQDRLNYKPSFYIGTDTARHPRGLGAAILRLSNYDMNADNAEGFVVYTDTIDYLRRKPYVYHVGPEELAGKPILYTMRHSNDPFVNLYEWSAIERYGPYKPFNTGGWNESQNIGFAGVTPQQDGLYIVGPINDDRSERYRHRQKTGKFAYDHLGEYVTEKKPDANTKYYQQIRQNLGKILASKYANRHWENLLLEDGYNWKQGNDETWTSRGYTWPEDENLPPIGTAQTNLLWFKGVTRKELIVRDINDEIMEAEPELDTSAWLDKYLIEQNYSFTASVNNQYSPYSMLWDYEAEDFAMNKINQGGMNHLIYLLEQETDYYLRKNKSSSSIFKIDEQRNTWFGGAYNPRKYNSRIGFHKTDGSLTHNKFNNDHTIYHEAILGENFQGHEKENILGYLAQKWKIADKMQGDYLIEMDTDNLPQIRANEFRYKNRVPLIADKKKVPSYAYYGMPFRLSETSPIQRTKFAEPTQYGADGTSYIQVPNYFTSNNSRETLKLDWAHAWQKKQEGKSYYWLRMIALWNEWVFQYGIEMDNSSPFMETENREANGFPQQQ